VYRVGSHSGRGRGSLDFETLETDAWTSGEGHPSAGLTRERQAPLDATAPRDVVSGVSEVLFVDPSISDLDTILGNLRPEVEAVVLDGTLAPARQMATALEGRGDLEAIHIVAHGAPAQMRFAAGGWAAGTLREHESDLAAVGRALRATGDLRLWSCEVGAGIAGKGFVDALSYAIRAPVAAADGFVGSRALGGNWELATRSGGASAQPPLTEVGMGIYAGILAAEVNVVGTVPAGITTGPVTYFIVDTDKKGIVGQVVLPNALSQATPVAMTVKVPDMAGSLAIGTFDAGGAFQPSTFLSVSAPPKPTGAVGPSAR
jgi:hypothetical protein